MLEKDLYINELYELAHIHDTKNNRHYPFEDVLLKKTTSPYLWKNENMYEYMNLIEKPTVLDVIIIDYARNFFNYTVDKYYNDYWG